MGSSGTNHTENWRRCMMSKRKLSTGEWRLFLLSDCIKYFKDADEFTRELRKCSKKEILGINGKDSEQLDCLISDEDAIKIKRMIIKEWNFTGRVKDNGRGVKTTCEYCQKQQIRYRYVCHNHITKHTLDLGSVCVGFVTHGEERMKNKDFAKKFVDDLERYKGSGANVEGEAEENYEAIREAQKHTVGLLVHYIKGNGYANNEFIASLNERWNAGKPLTDPQLEALKKMAKDIKEGKQKHNKPLRLTLEGEIQFNKVLLKLEKYPDNEFLQNCKTYIERHGELSENMNKALMGGKGA